MTIKIIGNSSSVLHIADHIRYGSPLDLGVVGVAHGHVVFDVYQGGIQVRGVELVRDAESERAILSPFLDNRVQEANCVHNVAPLIVRFDLFKEVLVDHGRVGTRQTSLETFGGLGGHLDGHAQKTDWELPVFLAGDP